MNALLKKRLLICLILNNKLKVFYYNMTTNQQYILQYVRKTFKLSICYV